MSVLKNTVVNVTLTMPFRCQIVSATRYTVIQVTVTVVLRYKMLSAINYTVIHVTVTGVLNCKIVSAIRGRSHIMSATEGGSANFWWGGKVSQFLIFF